jgi:hypothetical protein
MTELEFTTSLMNLALAALTLGAALNPLLKKPKPKSWWATWTATLEMQRSLTGAKHG